MEAEDCVCREIDLLYETSVDLMQCITIKKDKINIWKNSVLNDYDKVIEESSASSVILRQYKSEINNLYDYGNS